MSDYIQLNRSFRKLNTDEEQTDEAYKMHIAFGLEKKKTWSELLKYDRVIILAEAGAGKTEEFEYAAQSLISDGNTAFFLRLEHLSDSLKTAFEIGSFNDFKDWLNGDKIGYFFLDSVDEARLVDIYQFEQAIRVFSGEIGQKNLQRIRVFISSRITRWQPKSDLDFIRKHLPFYELDKSDGEEDATLQFDQINEPSAMKSAKNINIMDGTPLVVGMLSLDAQQMETYAVAKNLNTSDAKAMISEIYSLEVEDLASRPKDLDDIIGFWKTKKRVGTRLDLIERSLTRRISEDDPKRQQRDPLTIVKARDGVSRLAAAATFQQINRTLVPGTTPVSAGVDAAQILFDWSALEIQALLQRPIFTEQTYGTVRFYHRSVREYLTAVWLHSLLNNDKSRRDIEAIFFRNQYGIDVVVPTSRSVLSWMVLLDDRIREKTREIAPEVFIKNGDASRLPLATRKELLTEVCEVLTTTGFGRTYFTSAELYRFGKSDLQEHISFLISKYKEFDDVLDLLFQMCQRRKIEVGATIAFEVASDKTRSSYTRTNALYYLHAVSADNLPKFAESIITDESEKDQTVLSWVIKFCQECQVTSSQVVSLLKRYEPKSEYRYDSSYNGVIPILDSFSIDQCFDFVNEVYALLKTEPLIERKYLDISEHYKWLYPPALKAIERLVKVHDKRVLDDRFLELLSFRMRSHDFIDANEYVANFNKIIPEFQKLNDALFWYSIKSARQEGKEVKHFVEGKFWQRSWSYYPDDFDRVLGWTLTRNDDDNKLVALSLAFTIYKDNGRGDKRRRKLWKAVKGVEILESQLHNYLHPSKQSKSARNMQRQHRRWEIQDTKRKAKEAEILKDWQDYLASDQADQLLDVSIASEGKMWQGNSYLMGRARKSSVGSDKYASPEWQSLVPTYGMRAAERYRDAAVAYWRNYTPIEEKGSNSTSYATLFGLTGIAVEARENEDWLSRLTKSEARLAMKYAYQEINGFPDWVEDIFQKYPEIVMDGICEDIEYEICNREEGGQYFGTLNRITNRYPWFYESLSPRLIQLLREYEPQNITTLLNSLGIILQCKTADKSEILSLVHEALAKRLDMPTKAIWFAVWVNISADDGLKAVKDFTDSLPSSEKTPFVINWIMMLLGDRHENLRSNYCDFKSVPTLKKMHVFVHEHVRSSEDTQRAGTGVYSPNRRDNAQSSRSKIFNILSEIPGRQTYQAFVELSEIHPDVEHRPWYLHHARTRAELDADSTPWKSDDFAVFEKMAMRRPQNHQEVFDLCCSRLLDFKHHLENGDDSQALAMIKIDQETVHRNYYLKEFRDRANGFYTVTPEDELADRGRVDLRVHGSGLDNPVPIELKLAGNWAGNKLFERLENQLVGDYLRDMRSSRGVFLLVNRGAKRKEWHLNDGRKLAFGELVPALQNFVNVLLNDLPEIEEVRVIGIDLTLRQK